jgi:hypothetical protein
LISFIQLCELLTHNQRYSHFEISPDYLPFIDPEELKLVHVEYKGYNFPCRMWYPKHKWEDRPMDKESIRELMLEATERRDWPVVLKLRARLKEK